LEGKKCRLELTNHERNANNPPRAERFIDMKEVFNERSFEPGSDLSKYRFVSHLFPRDTARKTSKEWIEAMKKARKHFSDHKWTVEKLASLALNGDLQPLDRNDPSSISFQALLQVSFILGIFISCLIWNLGLTFSLPLLTNIPYQGDFMDILSLLELAFLNNTLAISGVFLLSIFLVDCHCQERSIKLLTKRIESLIRLISANVIKDENRHISIDHHQIWDRINTDLLFILFHYKIFNIQRKSVGKTFSFLSTCILALTMVFPIIARVHLPYLDTKGSRAVFIVVCFIMYSIPDLCMFPVCRANAESLKLYKNLTYLMAHIIRSSRRSRGKQVDFNEHLIWLLRKELDFPEKVRKQFSIITLVGTKVSYSALLKLHFWLGIAIVSIGLEFRFTENGSTRDVLASGVESVGGTSFLSDPLGLIGTFSV